MSRRSYDGKYKSLSDYLETQGESSEPMTFDQIERLLGFSLPKSAEHHQAWWANQPRGQSLAWLRAGYRSSAVSVEERRLTFLRADQSEMFVEDGGGKDKRALHLTIAEAKERLALTFKVDPSQIEITIRA